MNLYILHPERAFLELATALASYELRPDQVRACVFPGRPEPRSAQFVHVSEHTTYFHYRYIPDLEVRALLLVHTELPCAAPHPGLEDLFGGVSGADEQPWFEHWSTLRQDLHGELHQRAQRSAACWRLRGQWSCASQEDRLLCLDVLLDGVRQGTLSARRACAEQLLDWPQRQARAPLELAYTDEPDVEVRMHIRRALDRLDASLL